MADMIYDHKQKARPTAADVAKYMLVKKGSLTGYQLQKLLYYCQAWSLAVNREPLFDDEIHAFRNGPVVPKVWACHQGKRIVMPSDVRGDADALSDSEMALVDAVMDAYDGMTGDELADLSHQEMPWMKSWSRSSSASSSGIISNSDMQAYYAGLLASDDATKTIHHVPVFDHPKNIYLNEDAFMWLQDYMAEG